MTFRDDRYLEFVRSHPCIVSEGEHGVVAHHLRGPGHGGGMGLKPSDYRTVPINQFLHEELHRTGERSFWQRHGICPELYVCDMLRAWLEIRFAIHVSPIESAEIALEYIASVEKFLEANQK